ncbi:exostosin-like 3 [Brachionus plicatilis]|uniref:Exostosin-like 3 n=1 Tax=Brachionus plicatilis TaxID=10195 RepID=A0A3M7SL08_BRAPC|nr:exostosin-like 3 [Brachionus plicatilis]
MKLDLNSIRSTLNLSLKAINACFSIIILPDEKMFPRLRQFFVNNGEKTNFIFIIDHSIYKTKITKKILIEKLKDDYLEPIFRCSIFASFGSKGQLGINFGIIEVKNSIKYDLTLNREFIFHFKYDLEKPRSKIFFEYFKNYKNFHLSSDPKEDILLQSQFMVIIPDKDDIDAIVSFIDALRSGAVPVLLDLDYELPLSNLIAWDEVTIRLPFGQFKQLPYILSSISSNELIQRRIKAKMLFESYFESKTKQFRTIIAALFEKIRLKSNPLSDRRSVEFIPKFSKILKFNFSDIKKMEYLGPINDVKRDSNFFQSNYTESTYVKWNLIRYPFSSFPSLPFYNNYFSQTHTTNDARDYIDGNFFHSNLSGNYDQSEQFTMVIPTYSREILLVKYLENYFATIPYLNSILILWNSLTTEPEWNLWQNLSVFFQNKRLKILKMRSNSLNNRFLPFDLIKTEAILSLDDDVFLSADEIIFGFRIWRQNRERIVGYPARHHLFDNPTKHFIYGKSQLSCEYSLVLTGGAFYHKFYNYLYTYVSNSEIRSKVDKLMNCEDIAFNMMVAHLIRKPPIKVTNKFKFACTDCKTLKAGLPISRKTDHYQIRNECMDSFIKIYGYNPLLNSQYKANSVLFNIELPKNMKSCFNNL